MGLGKTVSALLLIHIQAALEAQKPKYPKAREKTYKTTLMLCPSDAFATWKGMVKKYFPSSTIRYFMGSREKGYPWRRPEHLRPETIH